MLQIILIVTYIRGLHLTPMQLNAAGSKKITVVEFQPANAWFILFSTVPRVMCYSHFCIEVCNGSISLTLYSQIDMYTCLFPAKFVYIFYQSQESNFAGNKRISIPVSRHIAKNECNFITQVILKKVSDTSCSRLAWGMPTLHMAYSPWQFETG